MSYGLKDLAKDYLSRKVEHVDDTKRNERLDICNSCEHKSKIGVCKLCGCLLKSKTTYTKASCPIGKW